MASIQNTFNLFPESESLLDVVIDRARDSMQDPNSDPIGHYPMFWIYAAVTEDMGTDSQGCR